MAGAGCLQLYPCAVHDGERLRQIAIRARGDAHFGPARRAQVACGALLGARRQAHVSRVQVRHREVAGDRRQLHRRGRAVARPEADHAPRNVPVGKGGCEGPDEGARGEREERPSQRRGRQGTRDVDLARRSGRAHVQQREQLRRDARRVLAGKLHAAEKLRRPADQARDQLRITGPDGGALQRGSQREPHHPTHRRQREQTGNAASYEGAIHARDQHRIAHPAKIRSE